MAEEEPFALPQEGNVPFVLQELRAASQAVERRRRPSQLDRLREQLYALSVRHEPIIKAPVFLPRPVAAAEPLRPLPVESNRQLERQLIQAQQELETSRRYEARYQAELKRQADGLRTERLRSLDLEQELVRRNEEVKIMQERHNAQIAQYQQVISERDANIAERNYKIERLAYWVARFYYTESLVTDVVAKAAIEGKTLEPFLQNLPTIVAAVIESHGNAYGTDRSLATIVGQIRQLWRLAHGIDVQFQRERQTLNEIINDGTTVSDDSRKAARASVERQFALRRH